MSLKTATVVQSQNDVEIPSIISALIKGKGNDNTVDVENPYGQFLVLRSNAQGYSMLRRLNSHYLSCTTSRDIQIFNSMI
jgi:hypothetical protein